MSIEQEKFDYYYHSIDNQTKATFSFKTIFEAKRHDDKRPA